MTGPSDTIQEPVSGSGTRRERSAVLTVSKKLLFAALVTVGLLLLLECALWIAGVQTLIEREDPLRGFSGLVTLFHREGGSFRTRLAARRNDFNDQSFAAEKPANGLRIFCLGGSSAYGHPYDDQTAFSGVLKDVLTAAYPRRSVEVVNAAGISYGVYRVNIVADEIVNYEPDIIVVYSGHNEFVEPSFFEELKRQSAVRNRIEYALAQRRIYSIVHDLWHRPSEQKAVEVAGIGRYVRREDSVVYETAKKQEIVEAFSRGLRRLIRTVHDHGVRVVVATVPCNLRQWRPRISLLPSTLSAAPRREHQAKITNAGRHLKASEFGDALAALRHATKIAPDHAETNFLMGQAYEGLGEWENAADAYRRACDLDGTPARRVTGINDAIRAVTPDEGALLVDVERSFEDLSEHGLVGFNLIEDYVHPTVEGHQVIAWQVWEHLERAGWIGPQRAAPRPLFDKVVAGRVRRPVPIKSLWLHNQAVILENQGQRQLAMDKYREVLRVAPNQKESLLNLAAMLAEDGEDDEALPLLKRLTEIAPQEVWGRMLHANIMMHRGAFREAAIQYREAIAIAPRNTKVHRNLGRALMQTGEHEEATECFQRVVKMEPRSAEAHANLGIIYLRRKMWPEASASLKYAINLDPENFTGRLNLGVLHFRKGRIDEARIQFRKAMRIKPDHAIALRYLKRAESMLREDSTEPDGS